MLEWHLIYFLPSKTLIGCLLKWQISSTPMRLSCLKNLHLLQRCEKEKNHNWQRLSSNFPLIITNILLIISRVHTYPSQHQSSHGREKNQILIFERESSPILWSETFAALLRHKWVGIIRTQPGTSPNFQPDWQSNCLDGLDAGWKMLTQNILRMGLVNPSGNKPDLFVV